MPAGRAARPVHVPGRLCRRAQPHDLRAGGGAGDMRGARGGDAANEALLQEISRINLELLRRRALE